MSSIGDSIRKTCACIGLGLLLALGACGDGGDGPPLLPEGSLALRLQPVGTSLGLNEPLFAGAPPGDTTRLFVVEKGGAIKIVDQPWADNWRADAAATLTEATLKKTGNKLAAVVASNDQTAGGAIGVLEKNNLAGKVLVSGQDAELDAVRRIVAGTQAMTVYKPLDALARMAADAAVRLAKGEAVDAGTTINNGKRDVPTRLLDPLACDKSNLDGLLINDGFHTREAIYGPGKAAGTH